MQLAFEYALIAVILAGKVEVYYRVFLPLIWHQLGNCKTGEQFTLALKECLEHRNQQALAKAPRAAQKLVLAIAHQRNNVLCLIHIHISAGANFAERLEPDWVIDFDGHTSIAN